MLLYHPTRFPQTELARDEQSLVQAKFQVKKAGAFADAVKANSKFKTPVQREAESARAAQMLDKADGVLKATQQAVDRIKTEISVSKRRLAAASLREEQQRLHAQTHQQLIKQQKMEINYGFKAMKFSKDNEGTPQEELKPPKALVTMEQQLKQQTRVVAAAEAKEQQVATKAKLVAASAQVVIAKQQESQAVKHSASIAKLADAAEDATLAAIAGRKQMRANVKAAKERYHNHKTKRNYRAWVEASKAFKSVVAMAKSAAKAEKQSDQAVLKAEAKVEKLHVKTQQIQSVVKAYVC